MNHSDVSLDQHIAAALQQRQDSQVKLAALKRLDISESARNSMTRSLIHAASSFAVDIAAKDAAVAEALGLTFSSKLSSQGTHTYKFDPEFRVAALREISHQKLKTVPAIVYDANIHLRGGSKGQFGLLAEAKVIQAIEQNTGLKIQANGAIPETINFSTAAGGGQLPALALPTPRLFCLLPWMAHSAQLQFKQIYGHVSLFADAQDQVLAPPFLYHDKQRRHFALVDHKNSLTKVCLALGFRQIQDNVWTTVKPASAYALRTFADPTFCHLIEKIYEIWPFADDKFDLSAFDTAQSEIEGTDKKAKAKAEREKFPLRYHAGIGLYHTTDLNFAISAKLTPLDREIVDAIADTDESGSPRPRWGTPDLATVLPFRDKADADAEVEILATLIEQACQPAWPNHWRPPAPADGLAYDEDQIIAIRHAMRGSFILVEDDMGVGKTYINVGIADALRNIDLGNTMFALFVVPASQRDTISIALTTIPKVPFTVRRIDLHGNIPEKCLQHIQQFDPNDVIPKQRLAGQAIAIVISYEAADRIPDLKNVVFDLASLDEAHYAKNIQSNRTASLIDAIGDNSLKARKFVFMSGTMMTNNMMDYWPFLRLLLQDDMTPYRRYKAIFDTKKTENLEDDGAEDIASDSRVGRIALALDSGIRIRRTKEELKKTPGKLPAELVYVPIDDPQLLIDTEEENRLQNELRSAAPQDRRRIRASISIIRKRIGLAKVPFVAAHLADLALNEPLVVFTYHKETADQLGIALKARNIETCIAHGGTPQNRRNQMIADFQSGIDRILITTLDAGGTAYTLHRAKTCAIVELDNKAHILRQAPDRLDRRGQTHIVRSIIYAVQNSYDATLATRFRRKTRLALTANGDDRRKLDQMAAV